MEFIKNYLKKFKVYYLIQNQVILMQYRIMSLYYKHIRSQKPISKVIIEKESWKSERLNIFYLGTDEYQDKSGFLQALSEFANIRYFTKEDGSYGAYSFGIFRRKLNIKKNQKRLLELLEEKDFNANILLMQMWEWRIGLETLKIIKNKYPNIKIINIAMDDRHSFWLYGFKKYGSAGLIPYLDCVWTTSSECVNWYIKEGIPAFFYPLASSSKIFYPIDTQKIYDVGFIGAKYGVRAEIVEKLKIAGIKVKAHGKGWEDGRLPIEDTNLFYNKCKIVLGVGTILSTKDFIAMKLRDFDVPMSGAVYITNYNEDLEKIYINNEEILLYRDIDECISKIKDILENEEKLVSIRRRALKKSILNNEYNQRIKQMFTNLIRGGVENGQYYNDSI